MLLLRDHITYEQEKIEYAKNEKEEGEEEEEEEVPKQKQKKNSTGKSKAARRPWT